MRLKCTKANDALYEVLPQVCGEMASYLDIDSKLPLISTSRQPLIRWINRSNTWMLNPAPPKKKRNCSIFEDISCILSVLCDSKPKTGCPFTSEFFIWCVKIQELNKMAIFTTTTAFDSMLKWHGYIGWSYEVDYTGRTTRKQTCGQVAWEHGMQQNRWTISISFPFPCCSRHCTWAGLRDVVG